MDVWSLDVHGGTPLVGCGKLDVACRAWNLVVDNDMGCLAGLLTVLTAVDSGKDVPSVVR